MREGVGALVQKGVYYREILLHKQKVLDIFNLKRGYEVQKYFFYMSHCYVPEYCLFSCQCIENII